FEAVITGFSRRIAISKNSLPAYGPGAKYYYNLKFSTDGIDNNLKIKIEPSNVAQGDGQAGEKVIIRAVVNKQNTQAGMEISITDKDGKTEVKTAKIADLLSNNMNIN
ncbi:MAG: hypothetical protein LBR90_03180, partial [Elusimicrobiota bacterium]|nr:hypothetical protein [Elusimicrobiota bacterium]